MLYYLLMFYLRNYSLTHSPSVKNLLQIIGQVFAVDKWVPLFNTLVRGEPLNLGLRNLTSNN